MNAHDQLMLSYEVRRHPDGDREAPLDAELRIGGAFGMRRDLNMGDELTVTVANADGEVIASGVAEVGPVGFKPIKLSGEVIGETRVHSAKLT